MDSRFSCSCSIYYKIYGVLDMKKDANEIINIIRVRPVMCLGEHSITLLHSLLVGYAWAVEDCTDLDDVSPPLGQLTWHLTHKYHILDALGWSGILLSRTNGNEEEALSLFWEEWDDFITKSCTCPQSHWENHKIVWRYCRSTLPSDCSQSEHE